MSDQQNGDASGDVNAGNGLGQAAAASTGPALAEKTLTGDLRDFILRLFRDERNPWHLMSEERQTRLAAQVDAECEMLVERAIGFIAAHDFPSLDAVVKEVGFKEKGIEIKLDALAFAAREMRHRLADSRGGSIVLVLADPTVFRGSRGIVAVDRQEPELPLSEASTGAKGHDENGLAADEKDPDEPGDEPRVVHLDDDGNPAVGYTLGYEDGRNGRAFADDVMFAPGSADLARYQAGWLQAQADGLVNDPRGQQNAIAGAAQHFREMGRVACQPGVTLADCPLAAWMPATKWWREGLLAAIAQTGADAAGAGEPSESNPWPEGSAEAEAWLSRWSPRSDNVDTGDETASAKRGRGRPRKDAEPPADQPGA